MNSELKNESQSKFNEKMWYLLAFVVWLLIAYIAIGWKDDSSRCNNDPGTNCPTEWEMRGGSNR